jgi:hypothetical protein
MEPRGLYRERNGWGNQHSARVKYDEHQELDLPEDRYRERGYQPDAGPFAPQSIGAQIDRQPTPSSVKRAEERAQAKFAATLARAKRFDARGDRAGCTRALAVAKEMYNLQ